MPLYTYKCPVCDRTKEVLQKAQDAAPECEVHDDARGGSPVYMTRVLSTPSAPQWNCRTAHSRSKGF